MSDSYVLVYVYLVDILLNFVAGDFGRIRPGDCLVAFSRNTIFSLKAKIEHHKGSHCAVVYGGLPSGE